MITPNRNAPAPWSAPDSAVIYPAIVPAIQPPIANARNAANTAHARAAKPVPLKLSGPVTSAPTAMPTNPNRTTATTAPNAPSEIADHDTAHGLAARLATMLLIRDLPAAALLDLNGAHRGSHPVDVA